MASSAPPDDLAWLVGSGIAIALVVAVLAAWTRQRPDVRTRVIAGGACALLAGALVYLLVQPRDVPTGWITILQEGRSARNIRQLYGSGTHAGPGFFAFVDRVAGHGPKALPAIVRANLCLAAVDAVVLLFLASHVLRSWWAGLAFAAAYACNLNTIQAAFSETPAMPWTLLAWLGCITGAVVSDARASGRLRWLALVCLGVLVALATSIRPETVILGVPALAIGVARVGGADAALLRALASAGRSARAIVAGPRTVFVLVAIGLLALELVPVPAEWRYAVAALRPLNFAFLTWLQAIALLFPFAIVVLFLLGTLHGVRHWLDFLLLPIGLLLLLKVYAAGSHGAFLDKFRYVAFIAPLVLFLALFGFRELSSWADRLAWPSWWKRVAVLLLVATVPAWNPWQREFFGRRHELPGVASTEAFLGRNQQTEVRYLLHLLARYPRCVLVAKTPRAESAHDPQTGVRWLVFGAPVPALVEREDAADGVDRIAAELAPDAPCVLFYRSMDCDLVDFRGCDVETAGRTPIEERTLENLPYSEIYEYGAHRPEIRLGVYPVAVRDRSAVAGALAASR